MKPVILLVDLQNDYLRSRSLEPAAGQVVSAATRLLEGARALTIPAVHVWTSVNPSDERRMPHWKRTNRQACVMGTEGHAPPPSLRPHDSERIVHKIFFSAFSTNELENVLRSLQADTLVVAGVHLHGCIRATVLDAYQRGFEIWVAEDAVASDDPLHAAVTQRYLASRAARFATVENCLALLPQKGALTKCGDDSVPLLPAAVAGDATICGVEQVSLAASAAKEAGRAWRTAPIETRCQVLHRLAAVLDANRESLAHAMAGDIGKPVTLARAELLRSMALLNAATSRAKISMEEKCTADSVKRHPPLGVVAMITPWNNPVAIPLGKIAPAFLYGNTVVWKPSPAGSALALKLMEFLREAGCPPGVVNLVCGDRTTALALMSDPQVDAVTITGSPAAGYSAQDICSRRHIPLQAELGGNNAAIIWSDCDLPRAAAEVADAAFAFAGQRCTANRRAIVDANVYERFLDLLKAAVAALPFGDPFDPRTRVGPLISPDKCREITALLERTNPFATTVALPHNTDRSDAYFPPTIICCDDPNQEIVQEETFGPVLVIQKAADFEHAIRLCNGVRQGLVASLFSASSKLHSEFLDRAEAGILKLNMATADANVEAPFGGWKASGIGPPEHGSSNREFYTRTQSVYRAS